MVTQEEDDLALPGDSPLWEFLGALVRAEAAILGDAADEERRLDATPASGAGRCVAEPAVEPRGGGRERGHQFLNAPEPTEERPRKRRRVTFASSELSALRLGAAPARAPPGRRRQRARPSAPGDDQAAGLLEHLHEALSRADAVGALVAAGDARTRDGRRRSLVRRELKSLLNEAAAIVHGTGSVRFNFDDPAALLHRALRALHDGGGPAWATELRAARARCSRRRAPTRPLPTPSPTSRPSATPRGRRGRAAGSKKKRKKRKRDKQKPLFDDLANSGVFLFPRSPRSRRGRLGPEPRFDPPRYRS
ncbi:hypothetical protein SO694_00022267 [Aureococcus anophagefferens]|uniref:Uncharacterized protein n=1 Tax=Aureococcus anophagefferens TaxID=44056 RepID=A0ABR1FT57_AURAN